MYEYYIITTWVLHQLLPYVLENYFQITWNYYHITTSLLPHYYRTITTSLLPDYYFITTSLLPHYYIRSKNYYQLLHNYYKRPPNYFLCKFDPHYYVITSITTYRPLLHDQLLHITTITTITNPHNLEMNKYNNHNYHCQDHRRFPTLRRGHTRRTWSQCLSLQKRRTGAIHEHTRPNRARQRKPHYRYREALSWRGPIDDCHGTFRRKRIAVNSLHPLVFSVSNHQTIEQSKMPLSLCWFLQFQCF